jgi:predicted DCC family thiol-disulfide oxidoreductase YuxK
MAMGKYILLFDGECNLCNRMVQFVIKHDKQEKFVFCSLQSGTGKGLLEKCNVSTAGLETFVLIKEDTAYLRSTAALEVTKEIGGMWSLLYVFILIPAFMRDAVYNFIAKRRYKIFGKTSCMVPSPELKSRFLE